MRRKILAAILLAGVAALSSAPANAAVAADVNLHFGQTYPVRYQYAPRVYAVPNSYVYYAPEPNYDMFRYGNRWYINDGGVWFSAQTYRGPFVWTAFESVPRTVLQVPARYHRQNRGYWSDHWWQSNNNGRGNDHHDNGRHRGNSRDNDD